MKRKSSFSLLLNREINLFAAINFKGGIYYINFGEVIHEEET